MEMNFTIREPSCFSTPNASVPLLEVLSFTNNHTYTEVAKMSQIICLLEGQANVLSDLYPKMVLKEKEAIFFPVDSGFNIDFSPLSKVIIIRLDPFQNLYNSYSIEDLFEENQKYTFGKEAGVLKIRYIFLRYLEDLILFLQHDFFNDLFYEIKIKELLFILYGYYEKKDLCNFFKPILNNDFAFASFVLNNWSKVRSVKQLAELSAYCETGFNKKFKKVFGITPYKWINEKKGAKIVYDIINSDKSFKEIAEEYNFNSQQQFNDYCIRNFNKTPGGIRKR